MLIGMKKKGNKMKRLKKRIEDKIQYYKEIYSMLYCKTKVVIVLNFILFLITLALFPAGIFFRKIGLIYIGLACVFALIVIPFFRLYQMDKIAKNFLKEEEK
jgi:fatty acid desaturase